MFNEILAFLSSRDLVIAAVTQQSSPQPIPSLPASPQNVQPMAIQAQVQSLSASPILTASSSPPIQTISPQVQQVPVSAVISLLMPTCTRIDILQPKKPLLCALSVLRVFLHAGFVAAAVH